MQLPFINDDYYDGVGGDHHNQGKEPGHGEDEHKVEKLLLLFINLNVELVMRR